VSKKNQEEKTMKNRISLVGIGLLFVSIVGLACTPVQKTIITKSDLPMLKGTWSGWTIFSSAQNQPVLTALEISNDTIPLQGKITLSNLPPGVASLFPVESLSAGNQVTIGFRNGKISDQGTIIGQSGENFLELTYSAGEKPKLDGWFYYYGARGTLTVKKQ
jgi:hypothetical protein